MPRKKTRKKTRKRKRASSFSFNKLIPGKIVLIPLMTAVVLTGLFFGARFFFLNSNFFKVKEIVVNKDYGYSFQKGKAKLNRLYKGRNIFSIDLKRVEIWIKKDFPQLRKVEVRRSLPEVLEVDIVSREAVALIDSGGGIVIDSEGVVLNIGGDPKDLLRIKGISFFLNVPSRGEKIDNKSLRGALSLLGALRKRMRENKDDIEFIDISDRKNILIGIYGVKVKMGTGDFFRKISQLREIVRDPNINMRDINYIDLRFEDAVISPR